MSFQQAVGQCKLFRMSLGLFDTSNALASLVSRLGSQSQDTPQRHFWTGCVTTENGLVHYNNANRTCSIFPSGSAVDTYNLDKGCVKIIMEMNGGYQVEAASCQTLGESFCNFTHKPVVSMFGDTTKLVDEHQFVYDPQMDVFYGKSDYSIVKNGTFWSLNEGLYRSGNFFGLI